VIPATGSPRGVAAYVDDAGYFVAHRAAIPAGLQTLRLATGTVIAVTVVSIDSASSLVLLRATDPVPSEMTPLVLSRGASVPRTVYAVLPGGPRRAELTGGIRIGVVSSTRRLVPLSEVRLEAPFEMVGNALLVSSQGELVGSVAATLGAKGSIGGNLQTPPAAFGSGVASGRNALSSNLLAQGPAPLTLAFTPSVDVIRRALEGFLSPERRASHPHIGVFCRDHPGGGALVQVVSPGSPADRAGIRAGDILLGIANITVSNQIDFAVAVAKQQVGSRITARISRSGRQRLVEMVVDRQRD
jgi:S1-C subfamily serine protease